MHININWWLIIGSNDNPRFLKQKKIPFTCSDKVVKQYHLYWASAVRCSYIHLFLISVKGQVNLKALNIIYGLTCTMRLSLPYMNGGQFEVFLVEK